jgi:hypothetical protein
MDGGTQFEQRRAPATSIRQRNCDRNMLETWLFKDLADAVATRLAETLQDAVTVTIRWLRSA